MKNKHQHPQHVLVEEVAIAWLEDSISWNEAVRRVFTKLGIDWPCEAEMTAIALQAAFMAEDMTE